MLPRMRLLAFLGIVPLGVYVAHLVLTAAADIRLAVVCGGLAALAAVALAHGQHLALRLAGGTRLPCWMMPLAAGWLALAGSFVRSGSVQFRNPLGAHKYVLLAVWIVGVGAAAVSWALTLKRETVARRGLAAAVAALLCSMAAFPAIRLHDVHGDEPYYLWMTKSVVADGDLDLTNNVAPWLYERLEVFPRAAGRSELHSGYLPAYALLLVPGHALAGDGGAIATQMAISALLAAELYLLLTAAFGSANGWRAWVTVAATAPLATLAVHIYPETTAALLVTVTLRRLWQTPAAGPVATAVLIGALVWLHPRYAYLACGLAVMLLWRERAQWRRAAGALLALALLAAGAWLHRRGLTPPGHVGGESVLIFRQYPSQILRFFLDQEYGLWFIAPVFLLLPAALVTAWRSPQPLARAALLLLALFCLFHGVFGIWGVGSVSGRYLTPLMPALAVLMGTLWAAAGPDGRRLLAMLLLASVALTALYAWAPVFRFERADGQNMLLAKLAAALPTWCPSLVSVGTHYSLPLDATAYAWLLLVLAANAVVLWRGGTGG